MNRAFGIAIGPFDPQLYSYYYFSGAYKFIFRDNMYIEPSIFYSQGFIVQKKTNYYSPGNQTTGKEFILSNPLSQAGIRYGYKDFWFGMSYRYQTALLYDFGIEWKNILCSYACSLFCTIRFEKYDPSAE